MRTLLDVRVRPGAVALCRRREQRAHPVSVHPAVEPRRGRASAARPRRALRSPRSAARRAGARSEALRRAAGARGTRGSGHATGWPSPQDRTPGSRPRMVTTTLPSSGSSSRKLLRSVPRNPTSCSSARSISASTCADGHAEKRVEKSASSRSNRSGSSTRCMLLRHHRAKAHDISRPLASASLGAISPRPRSFRDACVFSDRMGVAWNWQMEIA